MTGSRSWPKFWIGSWPKRVMTQIGHDPIQKFGSQPYWVMTEFLKIYNKYSGTFTRPGSRSWPNLFFGSWPQSGHDPDFILGHDPNRSWPELGSVTRVIDPQHYHLHTVTSPSLPHPWRTVSNRCTAIIMVKSQKK